MHTNHEAKFNPTPLTNAPRVLWGRRLAIATAVVFFISSAFPVVAGFVTDTKSWPKWWGMLDIGIAFLPVILVFVIFVLAHGHVDKQAEDASYRAYRILIHGIFAMILVFFLVGDRIVWINCLTGFAWRAWLFLYSLPAWVSVSGATIKNPPVTLVEVR